VFFHSCLNALLSVGDIAEKGLFFRPWALTAK